LNEKKVIELTDENVNQIEQLIDQKIQIWADHVVFSGLWWMGLGLSIIPWIIWFFIRKKDSTDRILYVGFYVMSLSMTLDILGDQIGFWHYRFNVIPVLPTYLPWDITLMPLMIMILLQFKPQINPWYKAIFFALISSYGAEPFFDWLEVYEPTNWRYTYSIPIQVAIYMSSYYLSKRNKFAVLD
jgi:hypothetical protein